MLIMRSNSQHIVDQIRAKEAEPVETFDKHGKRTSWTETEEQELVRLMRKKFAAYHVAKLMNRSRKSVTQKAHSMGLSFTAMRANL